MKAAKVSFLALYAALLYAFLHVPLLIRLDLSTVIMAHVAFSIAYVTAPFCSAWSI